jgi:hypothetical protein
MKPPKMAQPTAVEKRKRTASMVGKQNRARGAGYEREVAGRLVRVFGEGIKRRLGQAREGGHDIDGLPFLIECKRRRRLGPMRDWLAQVSKNAAGQHVAVVAKGDRDADHTVIMPMTFFLWLTRRARAAEGTEAWRTEEIDEFAGPLPKVKKPMSAQVVEAVRRMDESFQAAPNDDPTIDIEAFLA